MTSPRSEPGLDSPASDDLLPSESGLLSFPDTEDSPPEDQELLDAVREGEDPAAVADRAVESVFGQREVDAFLDVASRRESGYLSGALSSGKKPDLAGLEALRDLSAEDDLSRAERLDLAESYLARMPVLEGRLDHSEEQRLVAHLASTYDDPSDIIVHLVRLEQAEGYAAAADSSYLQVSAQAYSSVLEHDYPSVDESRLELLEGRVASLITDMRREGETDSQILDSVKSEVRDFFAAERASYQAAQGGDEEPGAGDHLSVGAAGHPGAEQE